MHFCKALKRMGPWDSTPDHHDGPLVGDPVEDAPECLAIGRALGGIIELA
jgi:hypothetical protein